jgi:hypothetical protein
MIDPHQVSIPSGPVSNTASIGQIKRHLQGSAACLLSTVVIIASCSGRVSGNRVLCFSCRSKLLAAGVPSLRISDRRIVDVEKNEATLIDVLSRVGSV